jgi:MFS family permease
MLNWYANTFRISEKNITKAGLRRTKVLTWLTLLIVPLEILIGDWFDELTNGYLTAIVVIAIFISLIALIGLLLSPLVHRFWARDKYLDEWEIEVKRKGMSAGYKVLFGTLVIGLIFSAVVTDYNEPVNQAVSYLRLDSLGFAVLILAFGVQTLTHLRLIRPVDEEDLEADAPSGNPVWARIAVVIAILMLFMGPPIVQGVKDGFNDAHQAQSALEKGS